VGIVTFANIFVINPLWTTWGMNWFIAVRSQRLFAWTLTQPVDEFLVLELLLWNYISNKTYFAGYSLERWELRRPRYCGKQGVCSRIDYSPTLHSIVSYNTATERRSTNDGNENILSFPIYVILFTFRSSLPPLFKDTKILANSKARRVISSFRREVHGTLREIT
jgi:hypothetical protein